MQCIACCQGRAICQEEIGSLSRGIQDCLGATQWHNAGRAAAAAVPAHQCTTLKLAKGELHVVEVAQQCRITCTEGALWITAAHRPCDYILKAGECMRLHGKGKILISSGGTDGVLHIVHT